MKQSTNQKLRKVNYLLTTSHISCRRCCGSCGCLSCLLFGVLLFLRVMTWKMLREHCPYPPQPTLPSKQKHGGNICWTRVHVKRIARNDNNKYSGLFHGLHDALPFGLPILEVLDLSAKTQSTKKQVKKRQCQNPPGVRSSKERSKTRRHPENTLNCNETDWNSSPLIKSEIRNTRN